MLAQASTALRSLGVINAGGRLTEWHHAGGGGAHLWRNDDIIRVVKARLHVPAKGIYLQVHGMSQMSGKRAQCF